MLGLIASLYLLLALRVRLTADASICGAGSSLSLCAGAAGVELRFDGVLRREDAGLHVTPRYGAPFRRTAPAKQRIRQLRAARPYLLAAVRAGRLEQVTLRTRLGLEDAAWTAMAAGAIRALACTLHACLGSGAPFELRVTPDFGGVGLVAHARCIFSCQAGDIMFAVIKTAVRKTGREGFGWKNIPLRA